MESTGDRFRLLLDTSDQGEILLAEKEVARGTPGAPPSNPSRFYAHVSQGASVLGWMRGHLGCTSARTGPEELIPRMFFEAGSSSRITFVTPHSGFDQRTVSGFLFHSKFPPSVCRVLLDGHPGVDFEIHRRGVNDLVMKALRCAKPALVLGLVPLQVGPREFTAPQKMDEAVWIQSNESFRYNSSR